MHAVETVAEACPLLGAIDDALCLIRIDLHVAVAVAAPRAPGDPVDPSGRPDPDGAPAPAAAAAAAAAYRALEDMARAAARAAGGPVRWWIGLGPRFFDRCGGVPAPAALIPLDFNGDAQGGVRQESADLLVAIGGAREAVIAGSRALLAAVRAAGHSVAAIDLGDHAGTDRGHSGFREGISNLQELSPARFAECVFVQPDDDPGWAGGTFLVLRKYVENVELWEDLPERVQEQMLGRRKPDSAFLDGQHVWSEAAWRHTHPCAHVRLAHPRQGESPWHDRLYRRAVKFTERDGDGVRHGLLFLALARDPARQVARVHNERLLPADGPRDLLLSSGYVAPIVNAVYFLPAARGWPERGSA